MYRKMNEGAEELMRVEGNQQQLTTRMPIKQRNTGRNHAEGRAAGMKMADVRGDHDVKNWGIVGEAGGGG